MNVILANSVGRLEDGRNIALFPSRCSAVTSPGYHWYPYELAYASSLIKRQHPEWNTRLIDGNLHGWNWVELGTFLGTKRPDVLVTECAALDYADMTKAMQMVRRDNPNLFAVLAGPFGMAYPEKARGDGWNTVICGEYEKAAITAIEQRQSGVIPYAGLVDIDALPYPEDRDICRTDYIEFCALAVPTIQMFPTRGCPLACSYCVAPSYYGGHGKSYHSYRTRQVSAVVNEMEYLITKYACSSFFFNDETSNADHDWTLDLCAEIQRRGLGVTIDAMAGYWTMDAEMVREMARAGYRQLRLGIESFDAATSATIGKRMLPDKFIHILEWLRAAGILAMGYVQVGAPGSTPESDLSSLEVLKDLTLRGLLARCQATISTPQPGTPYAKEAIDSGWIGDPVFSNYDWNHVILDRPEYPASEARRVLSEYRKYLSLRLRQ